MSALDAFIYNPSTTGNKFLSSKHDSWVSGVRGHSATYWPQSQLNNSRYNKKKRKQTYLVRNAENKWKFQEGIWRRTEETPSYTHTPTHHLLPVVRSWDWMTHPSGYTECVCVCVCVTLSLSAVFCDVREAMETVSGWLLASPRLSASSLVSLRGRRKNIFFSFSTRLHCMRGV